ncbi:uncharacterized protein F4807DRAFT_162518 [Annulohypoxylon truncatum]|uniref:uncharacterized protein n=1 Tax=Annulohypoxylon truncatum TaxID=327061 RepID=UPI00200728CD|nr:uncharacterized protein F4807DRAFT_162518 [Annulohypoxylon truncatum]KAI1208028.1 hypothetical protein F4807DRAFT_162518 [Annulohypoxylon truncatum]
MPLKKEVISVDLYAKLGVQSGASREEIRASYKELAIKWHPDKAGDTEQNKAEFRAVQEAWEILGDEVSRKEYDHARASQRPKLDDFIRGTYPEDPFEQPDQPSAKPQQPEKGGGNRRDGNRPFSSQSFLSGDFISDALKHMHQKMGKTEHELRVSHTRFNSCEIKLTTAYARRPPSTIKLRSWNVRLMHAKAAYVGFFKRLGVLKTMLPLPGQARVVPSTMTLLPHDIAQFSSLVFRVTIATLALSQHVEEFAKGRDNEKDLDKQLSIIAKPNM